MSDKKKDTTATPTITTEKEHNKVIETILAMDNLSIKQEVARVLIEMQKNHILAIKDSKERSGEFKRAFLILCNSHYPQINNDDELSAFISNEDGFSKLDKPDIVAFYDSLLATSNPKLSIKKLKSFKDDFWSNAMSHAYLNSREMTFEQSKERYISSMLSLLDDYETNPALKATTKSDFFCSNGNELSLFSTKSTPKLNYTSEKEAKALSELLMETEINFLGLAIWMAISHDILLWNAFIGRYKVYRFIKSVLKLSPSIPFFNAGPVKELLRLSSTQGIIKECFHPTAEQMKKAISEPGNEDIAKKIVVSDLQEQKQAEYIKVLIMSLPPLQYIQAIPDQDEQRLYTSLEKALE